ncbi:hypothetical protein B0T24DRAFT_665299 [Lasiosphaeria ovina]|uniref:Uncharacterized protein n=1 Tax=Lasiosphaeria ovina TaxID=92902 RepID=A0AAE0KI82_9PEZI|nr:hypothetical protein B0T24DRAFT_665299 [Lasiosphaeria ovina]
MKYTTALVFSLSLFSWCKAFVVPIGLDDGTYFQALDDKGSAIGEPVLQEEVATRDASFPTGGGSARVAKRQLASPAAFCHSRSYNGNGYSDALYKFDLMCDLGVEYPTYYAAFRTSGGTVAYMCNYENHNRCWRSEFDQVNVLLDAVCGWNVAGWVVLDLYKKSYGRDVQVENWLQGTK